MMKRIICLVVVLVMIVPLVPILMVNATASINIGDYIIMGKYYGEPILWRCVDIDQNGPLMLSDKILSIKPCDAEGEHPDDYASKRLKYGSNLWETSNMRSWLNSTASAGNVKWLCGNPPTPEKVWTGYNTYDDEAGFLSDGNFTAIERAVMKSVTQRSLLNYRDREIATSGETILTYNFSISDVVQNYDTAYANSVEDKMFLLDIKQLNRIYENRNILGDKYYVGQLTQNAAENCDYKSVNSMGNMDFVYWLRTPEASSGNPNGVRYVGTNGDINNTHAHRGVVGVRPAFYLYLSSVNENKDTPYKFITPTHAPKSVISTTPTTTPTPTPTPTPISVIPLTVILDGKRLFFDVEPSIQDGRTLVPLRGIFEALGANIVWDDRTKTIIAKKKIADNIVAESDKSETSKKSTSSTTEKWKILRNYAADLDRKAGVNQPKTGGKPVTEKAPDHYIQERMEGSSKPKTKTTQDKYTEIKLKIGDNIAYKDGKTVELDVPAVIVDGRTLVPLRFVSQSLGANVAWDGDSRTITINSK